MKALVKIEFTLNSDPLEIYGGAGELALHKEMGESYRHLALKMVSYFLFYHPELEIERSAQQHYKPDLLRVDAGGTPLQWIDCGTRRDSVRCTSTCSGVPPRSAMGSMSCIACGGLQVGALLMPAS